MCFNRVRRGVEMLAAMLTVSTGIFAAVVYVDKDNSSGIEDGASWATAFTTLQPAMDAATPNDSVWIAAGTYDEQRDSSLYGAVYIKSKLHVFGGFDGTETSLSQRDAASR